MARYRLGHTGITRPSGPDGTERAIAAVAALDYRGSETFGPSPEQFAEEGGGIGRDLERHGLPLVSAYCWGTFVDPVRAEEDVRQVLRQARLLGAPAGDGR